jgi:hypothetical protein
VKKDHFALVFSVFVQNGARDNLISSAVIDIVEFIRTENITSLIKYAVEGFPGIFDNIDFVTTFKALKLKYDQNMEYERSKDGEEETSSNDDAKITALRKARAADDEEAYFDADDDDEDIPPSSSSTTTTTSSSPSAKLPESLSPPEGPLKLDLVRASTPPPPPFSPKSPREYDHDMNPTVMPPSENPLSPSYKARPLSPPILSKDTLLKDGSKDSLGMMFDMTKRAPVTNARNTVRKIEMVIGTSTVTPSDASPAEDMTSSSSENDVKRQKL